MPRPGDPRMIAAGAALGAWVDPPLVAREVRYLMNSNPELDPEYAAGVVISARQVLAIIGMPVLFFLQAAVFAFLGGIAELLPATAKFMVGEANVFVFAGPGALVVGGAFLFWVTAGSVRAVWWRRARSCGAPWESHSSPWNPRLWWRRPPEYRLDAFDTPEQAAASYPQRLVIKAIWVFLLGFPVLGGVIYLFESLGTAMTIVGL